MAIRYTLGSLVVHSARQIMRKFMGGDVTDYMRMIAVQR
jgi:hypothetical protein